MERNGVIYVDGPRFRQLPECVRGHHIRAALVNGLDPSAARSAQRIADTLRMGHIGARDVDRMEKQVARFGAEFGPLLKRFGHYVFQWLDRLCSMECDDLAHDVEWIMHVFEISPDRMRTWLDTRVVNPQQQRCECCHVLPRPMHPDAVDYFLRALPNVPKKAN